jgi:uncharacterized protein (DUF433 family)
MRKDGWPVKESLRIFSREQAAKFCGVSPRRLTIWARQGVVVPTVAFDDAVRPFVLLYDFTDLVCIRTLATLIERYRFTPRQLQHVQPWFREHVNRLPADILITLRDHHICILEPNAMPDSLDSENGSQQTQLLSLDILISELKKEIEQAQQRQPEDIGKIARHRDIQHNAPVIAGTRIPTSTIWNYHEDGYKNSEILDQFPHITLNDIAAAIEFEARRRHAA